MIRTVIFWAALLASTQAFAQFEVEDVETEENVVQLRLNNAIIMGGVATGAARNAHEFEVTWGVAPGWKTGAGFLLQNVRGGSFELDEIEWTNVFGLIGSETIFDISRPYVADRAEVDAPFSLSIFGALSGEIDGGAELAITAGPLLGLQIGPVEATANALLFFPVSGGDDTAFLYAASVMYELSDNLAFGAEAHSEVASVFDNTPSFRNQQHFLGPVADFELGIADNRELGIRVGGMFGLSNASPDFALSVNLELEFN